MWLDVQFCTHIDRHLYISENTHIPLFWYVHFCVLAVRICITNGRAPQIFSVFFFFIQNWSSKFNFINIRTDLHTSHTSARICADMPASEDEAVQPVLMPADVGTDSIPIGWKDKKSAHLLKAEKMLKENKKPAQSWILLFKPLLQDARLRGKSATHVFVSTFLFSLCAAVHESVQDFTRAAVLESILLQSRADTLYDGKNGRGHPCGHCEKKNGPYISCRVLNGHRDGACGNCVYTGESAKICSFVPGNVQMWIGPFRPILIFTAEVKDKHKRKRTDDPLTRMCKSVHLCSRANKPFLALSATTQKRSKMVEEVQSHEEAYQALAYSFGRVAELFAKLAKAEKAANDEAEEDDFWTEAYRLAGILDGAEKGWKYQKNCLQVDEVSCVDFQILAGFYGRIRSRAWFYRCLRLFSVPCKLARRGMILKRWEKTKKIVCRSDRMRAELFRYEALRSSLQIQVERHID